MLSGCFRRYDVQLIQIMEGFRKKRPFQFHPLILTARILYEHSKCNTNHTPIFNLFRSILVIQKVDQDLKDDKIRGMVK